MAAPLVSVHAGAYFWLCGPVTPASGLAREPRNAAPCRRYFAGRAARRAGAPCDGSGSRAMAGSTWQALSIGDGNVRIRPDHRCAASRCRRIRRARRACLGRAPVALATLRGRGDGSGARRRTRAWGQSASLCHAHRDAGCLPRRRPASRRTRCAIASGARGPLRFVARSAAPGHGAHPDGARQKHGAHHRHRATRAGQGGAADCRWRPRAAQSGRTDVFT